MKTIFFITLIVAAIVFAAAAPANDTSSPSKKVTPFVSSFDEIVVESSLTVRGKNGQGRQGRTKLVVVDPKPSTPNATSQNS